MRILNTLFLALLFVAAVALDSEESEAERRHPRKYFYVTCCTVVHSK